LGARACGGGRISIFGLDGSYKRFKVDKKKKNETVKKADKKDGKPVNGKPTTPKGVKK
jgi:hypothetical protein